MPTVNEVLGGLLEKLIDAGVKNWKSTLSSILTTGFGVTGYLMASSTIKPRTAVIALSVNGFCKIALGIMQKDGGSLQIPAGSTLDVHTDAKLQVPKEGR